MSVTEFTVQYDRKFSDGNYGSEGLSLSTTFSINDADLTSERMIDYATELRRVVLSFLAGASSSSVSRAAKYELNPPQPVSAPSSAPIDLDEPDMPW
jgi:hypothetical protein